MKKAEKNWIHFSDNPDLSQTDIVTCAGTPDCKPERGFWFSDEDNFGWSQWCTGEKVFMGDLRYSYTVSLRPEARIAHLDSVEAIRTFHAQYAYPLPHALMVGIHWEEVAKRYDVVLITPYQWSLRLDPGFMWYYSWDCASGVVLNPGIVQLGPKKGVEKCTKN